MKSCIVEQPRTACAIGGFYTALAIPGIVPVLHCGPGCVSQSAALLASANGAQNAHPFNEHIIPCTDFGEADVVFGGGERLRKNIENVARSYKADMILAINGCSAEIVGDDNEEVARGFSGGDIPVLAVEAAGFRGNNLYGHSQVLKAILNHVEPTGKAVGGQVNVWGVAPFYDTFWAGTLEKIGEALTEAGLAPNIIYGRNGGLDKVKAVPSAEFNLLLGPWVDLDIVRLLKERFGTPYFHYPAIPVGPTETARFLRELGEFAGLDRNRVETRAKEGEERYYHYIRRSLLWVYRCRALPKRYYINSGASTALSLHRYLVNDMGLIPCKIFLPEDVPEEHQERVEGYFRDVELDSPYDVVFTGDGGLAAQEIAASGRPKWSLFYFGSVWDEPLSNNERIPFLSVSAPQGNVMAMDKTYFGYDGALRLYSDYYEQVASKGLRTS
ncbi:MAG: nitrogenase molybdenum-iron protein, alpha and beta chain [Clostridiales Family XIII bacterium]|jgi:nitrogenase molybdenum-iron protein beta chain|nr:nitrogenase molybdenum-iron protein, alpha and beta chain [Clostridiales Family XIII bacterium]